MDGGWNGKVVMSHRRDELLTTNHTWPFARPTTRILLHPEFRTRRPFRLSNTPRIYFVRHRKSRVSQPSVCSLLEPPLLNCAFWSFDLVDVHILIPSSPIRVIPHPSAELRL
ncbi:hypothetical protein VTJ04DRAFT_9208 [Mycothermus thermophilus]|uniref:uncharacterized protein n=1 Tax=Humicola insolens TaxID=85995 RepID=UPI003742D54F